MKEDFDHKGCTVILCLLACFWIAVIATGVSVWQAFAQPFPVLP